MSAVLTILIQPFLVIAGLCPANLGKEGTVEPI
jgi:hypothetical protein